MSPVEDDDDDAVVPFKSVELSNLIESIQFDPHSGWHCAHGNCDENDAKK